ncbi:MAG: hypothetical protein ACREI2_09890 [Nitrospiraceae bacterium]
MTHARNLSLAVACAMFMLPTLVVAADQQVTLTLGGKFCEFYGGDVQKALMNVTGVKGVDLGSKRGHAVVTVEAGKVNPAQLAAAVNAVKGDGWHCKSEVVK